MRQCDAVLQTIAGSSAATIVDAAACCVSETGATIVVCDRGPASRPCTVAPAYSPTATQTIAMKFSMGFRAARIIDAWRSNARATERAR
ncbi:MAG: hypothetical protein U0168_08950 [Nannocystaceae bacterium]